MTRYHPAVSKGASPAASYHLTCHCGQAALETVGTPILAPVCYCTDCQEAGRQFEQLIHAPQVREGDGGTQYVLFRTDRVRCVQGEHLLAEHRLSPDSKTRRVLATCCNSPMFLDVSQGHWLTLYRRRFGEPAPAVDMRVMTREKRPEVELPNDVPNYPGHSGKFMWKLLRAWFAMGFRVPKVSWGKNRTAPTAY